MVRASGDVTGGAGNFHGPVVAVIENTGDKYGLGYGLEQEGQPVETVTPYAVFDSRDLKKLPGVYLGALGLVAWEFQHDSSMGADRYAARLLTTGENPLNGSTVGLLRVAL